ncbi:MAG: YkgJ family cysteine cluster protein [Campylobacterota bacterium]|nr:YkgJ family cysteine cluster protein [Campylobacterota bacterium]
MSNIMKEKGFNYAFNLDACATCQGRCCTGDSGYIYLNRSEIEKISLLLGIPIKEFINQYLFKKMYKYSIKEIVYNGSHECVFYDRDSNGCKIYDARPTQCKTFPFWDYYKTRVEELKLECPGVIDD